MDMFFSLLTCRDVCGQWCDWYIHQLTFLTAHIYLHAFFAHTHPPPCHNCKWWWIFAARLTRGRRWRRGVSRDGERTEDRAHGSRLAAKKPWGLTEGSVACQKLIQEHTRHFVFTVQCNVHAFVALLWTLLFCCCCCLGIALGIKWTVPKWIGTVHGTFFSWERIRICACSLNRCALI